MGFGNFCVYVCSTCVCDLHACRILVVTFVFHIVYTYIKTILFAFVLATIPSYHGFFMKGGALEVGKASNISFVWTSSVIIIINFIVTQLLLA